MRETALGHWQLFTWHLPSVVLMLVGILVISRMSWSLSTGHYNDHIRSVRWKIIGWCAVWVTSLTPIVWPYLRATARIEVGTDGTWYCSNYLGFPLGRISPGAVRRVRAEDLGGFSLGTGTLLIERDDGTTLESVRIDRSNLRDFFGIVGYSPTMIHSRGGDLVVDAHVMNSLAMPQPVPHSHGPHEE